MQKTCDIDNCIKDIAQDIAGCPTAYNGTNGTSYESIASAVGAGKGNAKLVAKYVDDYNGAAHDWANYWQTA